MEFLGRRWSKKSGQVITLDDGLHGMTYYEDPLLKGFLVDDDVVHVVTGMNRTHDFLALILEVQTSEKTLVLVPEVIEDKYSRYFGMSAYKVVSFERLIATYPKNLEEKLHRSLGNLARSCKTYGQSTSTLGYPLFFSKNLEEFRIVHGELLKRLWITGSPNIIGTTEQEMVGQVKVEAEGWRVYEAENPTLPGTKVFVAMMFDDSMDLAYSAIENAITDLGLEPVRVDRVEHNEWITGKILELIDESACVVADFTGQRAGVYYEAGYAKGARKPVVFTCRKTDFETNPVHFDTRQYSHVLWDNETDLYEKIKSRVGATLGLRP